MRTKFNSPEEKEAYRLERNRRKRKAYAANASALRKRARELGSSAKWHRDNADITRETLRDWRVNNPERYAAHNRKSSKKYQRTINYKVLLENRKGERDKAKREKQLAEYLSKPKWNPRGHSEKQEKKAGG
jgi:predicted transglutaminase-like protease